MDTIAIEKLQYLQIGQQGEHNALTVPIDMTSWVEEYPDSDLYCFALFVPPGEKNPWPMTSTWDADTKILTWEVTANATAVDGQGYLEIRALENTNVQEDSETHMVLYEGMVKKSRVIPTLIDHSVSGVVGGSRPAPYQDFLNQVLEVRRELNEIFEGTETTYQISTSAATIPTGTWLDQDELTPTVMAGAKGKFLWSRTRFEWGTGAETYTYSISYIGNDTTGAVTSFNGATGDILMGGETIKVDVADQDSETIQEALENATILPLTNSAPVSTASPDSDDYLLVAANDEQSVSRRKMSDIFTTENIAKYSSGGIIKSILLKVNRTQNIPLKSINLAAGGTVYIRQGHYEGEIDYVDGLEIINVTVNETTFWDSSFDRSNGTIIGTPLVGTSISSPTGKRTVKIPYYQIGPFSGEMLLPPETIYVHLYYAIIPAEEQ